MRWACNDGAVQQMYLYWDAFTKECSMKICHEVAAMACS